MDSEQLRLPANEGIKNGSAHDTAIFLVIFLFFCKYFYNI